MTAPSHFKVHSLIVPKNGKRKLRLEELAIEEHEVDGAFANTFEKAVKIYRGRLHQSAIVAVYALDPNLARFRKDNLQSLVLHGRVSPWTMIRASAILSPPKARRFAWETT